MSSPTPHEPTSPTVQNGPPSPILIPEGHQLAIVRHMRVVEDNHPTAVPTTIIVLPILEPHARTGDGNEAPGVPGEGASASASTIFDTETTSDCYTKQHCHLVRNVVISNEAYVLNGHAGVGDSTATGMHHLEGGRVEDRSRLVNGNMDTVTFMRMFSEQRGS